jgi:acyl-CoA synthetase (AMP-forming)/AMP-acid ligase II
MAQPDEPRFLDDRPAYWAKNKPDDVAVIYLDRKWTWAQFDDRVRRLAGALADRGIGRGDVVAFLDKNHPACIETTIAAATGANRRVAMVRSTSIHTASTPKAISGSGRRPLLNGSQAARNTAPAVAAATRLRARPPRPGPSRGRTR